MATRTSVGGTVSAVSAHFRTKFFAGILALIPLVVTFIILRLVYNWIDGLADPAVEWIFDRDIPGLSVAFAVVVVYLMGVLATNLLGQRGIRYFEFVMLHLPIVRWVYAMAKQVIDALTAAGKGASRVVMVEWPRKGAYTIGFVTGSVVDQDGKIYHIILITNTPTPQGGLMAIMPEEDVIFTNLTMDEAIKMIVSSGVITPEDLMRNLKNAQTTAAAQKGAVSPGAGTIPV